MKTLLAPLLLCLALLVAPGSARAAKPIPITPEITTVLHKIEAYLEDIKTLQADFLQITSTGETSSGEILLSRPKNLRIEYAPPSPILIVANSKYLSYVDKELKQVNHIALEDTPAAFLLREKFTLIGGELSVTGFEQAANTVRVSLVKSKDPLAGELTLVFTENPMVLRKWVIIDAQGIITDFTLINTRFDFPIPENKFPNDFSTIDPGK
ncbi:MAG: outer membrane lipoprotein carrier protein LolA [Rhodospirillales bacterium]